VKKETIAHQPQRVLIYWSFVPELWSKLIVSITGRDLPDNSDCFSHMGIAFEFEDYTTEAFEALFEKGFFGPEPMQSIVEKVEKKSGHIVIRRTDISGEPARAIYEKARDWVGTMGYNRKQLASMWFFERFGRVFGLHVPHSPRKVVCSEAVARLVAGPNPEKIEWPCMDLRDKVRARFDEVNPNSGYRSYIKIMGSRA